MERLIGLVTAVLLMSHAIIHPLNAAGNSSVLEQDGTRSLSAIPADGRSGHSSLDWSQGILGMVTADAPTVPVYSWDAGTVECDGQPRSATFYLKNFGTESIALFSAPILPEIGGFSRTTTCRCTNELAPGEMDTCRFVLWFNPSTNGVAHDTMRIQTNAWNSYGGFVRFPLIGQCVSTPPEPQVLITPEGSDFRLRWNPVRHSVLGCALSAVQYSIYSSAQSDGVYSLLTTTSDTTYVGALQAPLISRVYYLVTAQVP